MIGPPGAPPGKRVRLVRQALATVLGGRPAGVFVPYRDAPGLSAPAPVYRALAAHFESRRDAFLAMLAAIDARAPALEAIGGEPKPAPRWDQGWFPTLDAAAAYTLVRDRAPARIVEIGSGHSTRFLARAVADGGLATRLTAIDPSPRADLAGLAVDWRRRRVQDEDPADVADLAPGDVLFVDSSHVALPGSDVDWLIARIVPALPPGVLVHVHDIALPDDYPPAWLWRRYSEQLAVAALIAGGGFRVLFAAHWVETRLAEAVAGTVVGRLPRFPGAPAGSLWLEKTAPALGPAG